MRLRASSSITVASLVSSLGGSSGGGRCREEAAFQPRVEEEKLRKRKKSESPFSRLLSRGKKHRVEESK